MRNIIENISLKKLSWLAALPVSLAAFSASIVPAQASEHHRKDNYNYSYCSRWEHRHEYRCSGYYHPRYEESRYNHNDKWDYRYHKKDHHDSYRSDWKR